MREYKISKGWAIFIYIVAPLFIIVFAWFLITPFIPSMQSDINMDWFYWFFVPMALAMIAMMTIGIIDTARAKFVIDKNKIFTVGIFSNRELMFYEIKGYRVTDKYIFIEPHDEGKKKIKISKYFEKTGEITHWLSKNYENLDVLQIAQEKEEILTSETFGWTIKQREERLIKAQKTAKILNWIGGLTAVWTFVWPNPYEYAILASITIPIICAIVLRYFKGLIRVDEKNDTAYPTLFWAMFATSMGLVLRSFLDYNLLDYSKIWTPAIFIALTYVVVVTIENKNFKFSKSKDYLTMLSFTLYMFGYGCGAITTLNCLFDKSEAAIFKAKILSKRVNSGKVTIHYAMLTPWGQQKEAEEVTVSEKLYNTLEPNDSVKIYVKNGRFDIPWFEVIK